MFSPSVVGSLKALHAHHGRTSRLKYSKYPKVPLVVIARPHVRAHVGTRKLDPSFVHADMYATVR
jgi:hypothetical protein